MADSKTFDQCLMEAAVARGLDGALVIEAYQEALKLLSVSRKQATEAELKEAKEKAGEALHKVGGLLSKFGNVAASGGRGLAKGVKDAVKEKEKKD